MNIIQFENKYLDEMAQLFAEVYSELGTERVWNLETAKKYLERDIVNYPEYCLVILNDGGSSMGGVFCRIDPYYQGQLLFVDSVQVKPEYRKQGIAKKLLQEVFKIAKRNGVEGVHLLADAREGFPRSWYEKLGFELSGWAEYESHWDKLGDFIK